MIWRCWRLVFYLDMGFHMSWQKVTVTCTLVIGAVTSAALGNEALALVLAGGATGFIAQHPNGLIAKPKG